MSENTQNLHIENTTWQDLGFFVELTADQSPSLRLIQSNSDNYENGEAMHHSGGAMTETNLIYADCIQKVFNQSNKPAFLVVGLGLGYIEMCIAREALLKKKDVDCIRSFESVTGLRQGFYNWLWGLPLSLEMQTTYDLVCSFVIQECGLTQKQIQDFLRTYFPQIESLDQALERSTLFEQKFDGILYDAFSSKTSPLLWEEDFLAEFLDKAAKPKCFLATYACKGTLKRALKKNQFNIEDLLGFKSKRNRISAFRN